ncbi:response regulator [Candidatus Saccharibacteria bacterium]|nr:response regulator [Candidatus Saccharibacteria bacterium]
MTKLMIVEDDIALREIYSIRLTAEGYTIVVAGDGEEALAVAVQEKPDLILSDVMMPKISGFDMLDIIRSTPELKDVKVVMMTALSSPEQRARGESLGADRYLVKSQVGIEDVVNVIHEVLGDAAAPAPAAPAQAAVPAQPVAPVAQPAAVPAMAPVQPAQGAVNAVPVNPAQ